VLAWRPEGQLPLAFEYVLLAVLSALHREARGGVAQGRNLALVLCNMVKDQGMGGR
jgi:hypothetical protein